LYKIPANTLFMGKNLVFVPECHSTNTLAHDLTSSSLLDGTVVITSNQTAGRGQRGNTWSVEPGMNLTFSLVVKPSFLTVNNQFFLNVFTSLAIHDLLRDKLNAIVRIKWPNDLLAGDRKLCGILIENQIQGQQVSKSVIGIGLNVNQQHFSFPGATSMAAEEGVLFELNTVFELLLIHLEQRYLQLREGRLPELKAEYLKHLYRLNEEHFFSTASNRFSGRITGIDESGKLVIESDGKMKTFGFQEIKFAG
jgi:BirA family transcriptional regulator, biotin operon repressor / biotin---[acetyl-CoA-carboxylase] ligase